MTEAERIGEILRSLAPEHNRSGWIAEQADAMQMGEGNFKSCFYGTSAPSADNLRKMELHFGRRFWDGYLEGTGYRVASEEEARQIDARRDCLDKIEEGARGLRALGGGK